MPRRPQRRDRDATAINRLVQAWPTYPGDHPGFFVDVWAEGALPVVLLVQHRLQGNIRTSVSQSTLNGSQSFPWPPASPHLDSVVPSLSRLRSFIDLSRSLFNPLPLKETSDVYRVQNEAFSRASALDAPVALAPASPFFGGPRTRGAPPSPPRSPRDSRCTSGTAQGWLRCSQRQAGRCSPRRPGRQTRVRGYQRDGGVPG